MPDWILVPCLVQLHREFDQIAPNRATGADGSIGDTAHEQRVSDHNGDESGAVPIHDADHLNEVHALDITTDLRQAGLTLEQIVQHIVARCRSGAEGRLRYIIFNRRIWQAEHNWRQEIYTGSSDPHTGHAHFSASYTTANEASTASWHLEDLVALTDAEIVKIADTVWNRKFASPYDSSQKFAYDFLRYAASRDTTAGAVMTQVKTELAGLKAALLTAIAADNVGEQALGAAIAQQILAGLPAGRDDITAAELQTAIVGALRELAAPQEG